MDQQMPRTPLTLDVVGQPVANATGLRTIVNQLTAIQGIWFAVDPWPEDVAVIYVKPENAERLAEIIRETTDPMTRQLEAKLRAQAKAAFHDEGTLEIDDEAPVSLSGENRGKGAYVQAWVWVRKDGDHTCTACEGEWFGFELRPEPSTPQQSATGEEGSARPDTAPPAAPPATSRMASGAEHRTPSPRPSTPMVCTPAIGNPSRSRAARALQKESVRDRVQQDHPPRQSHQGPDAPHDVQGDARLQPEPQSKTCADIHDAWCFVNEQCGLLGIPLPTPSPTASH